MPAKGAEPLTPSPSQEGGLSTPTLLSVPATSPSSSSLSSSSAQPLAGISCLSDPSRLSETPEDVEWFGDVEEQGSAAPGKRGKGKRSALVAAFQVFILAWMGLHCALVLVFDYFAHEPLHFINLVDGVSAIMVLYLIGSLYVMDWGASFLLAMLALTAAKFSLSLVASCLCANGVVLSKCTGFDVGMSMTQSLMFNGAVLFMIGVLAFYVLVYARKARLREEQGAFLHYSVQFWGLSRFLYIPFLYEVTRLLSGQDVTSLCLHTSLAFGCAALCYIEVLTRPSVDLPHRCARLLSFLLCCLSLSVAFVLYLLATTASSASTKTLNYILLVANAVIFVHFFLYFRYHKGRRISYHQHRTFMSILTKTKVRKVSVPASFRPRSSGSFYTSSSPAERGQKARFAMKRVSHPKRHHQPQAPAPEQPPTE